MTVQELLNKLNNLPEEVKSKNITVRFPSGNMQVEGVALFGGYDYKGELIPESVVDLFVTKQEYRNAITSGLYDVIKE